MITVGITGGIGTGKSTVVEMFKKLGVFAYSIDDRSKHLVNTNKHLRKRLVEMFGSEVFFEDGSYNTKLVSDIVFNDKESLNKLTDLFSKFIDQDYKDFLFDNLYEDYVVVESAFFHEYNIENWVDFMIGVDVKKDYRIYRIQLRNPNLTVPDILKRIDSQMAQEEKMVLCDFVLNNDDKVDEKEVFRLNNLFIKIANL